MTDAHADVVLVGAGPHALTCAARIRAARPGHTLRVIDPSGGWMVAWHRQMARQDIDVLRSAGVHQPDPDAMALIHSATHSDPDGLVGEYLHPSTAVFARFCADLVRRCELQGVVERGHVCGVEPASDHVVVRSSDGRSSTADRVVLATNSRRAVWPAWAEAARRQPGAPVDGLRHVRNVDLGRRAEPGRRVVVVGGGLSAVQYALGAHQRGAHVTMLARRQLTERTFDVDPGWLGPKHLDRFSAVDDWDERAAMVVEARGGGTVPERWLRELRVETGRSPRLDVIEGDEVVSALADRRRWCLVTRGGRPLECDEVWLATGATVRVDGGPYRSLMSRAPVAMAGGLPVLDEDLAWAGTRVHVVGAAAALQLGPAAGNLAGARAATARVTGAVTGTPTEW
ncbi:MAG: FAD-dependent oxidoreductase [Acidimicrobiales bacterium]